jgi:hypothetical protein
MDGEVQKMKYVVIDKESNTPVYFGHQPYEEFIDDFFIDEDWWILDDVRTFDEFESYSDAFNKLKQWCVYSGCYDLEDYDIKEWK